MYRHNWDVLTHKVCVSFGREYAAKLSAPFLISRCGFAKNWVMSKNLIIDTGEFVQYFQNIGFCERMDGVVIAGYTAVF